MDPLAFFVLEQYLRMLEKEEILILKIGVYVREMHIGNHFEPLFVRLLKTFFAVRNVRYKFHTFNG